MTPAEFRADKTRRIADLLIEQSCAMLDDMAALSEASRRAGPWKRAVRSKNRRIRRKGEKRRLALSPALIMMAARGAIARAKMYQIMAEAPPAGESLRDRLTSEAP